MRMALFIRIYPEAYMRMNNAPIIMQSHIVLTLHVHLPGGNFVVFDDGAEGKAAERDDKSHLLAFFKLNEEDEEARQYTFGEIPMHYRYDQKEGTWIKRAKNPDKCFVRISHVNPRHPELYALRLLLMKVKGPTSFENLRTVVGKNNDEPYTNFVKTAEALGIWESDELHIQAVREALNEMKNPKQKKYFFAMVLAHNGVNDPDAFLDLFLDDLFLAYGKDPNIDRKGRRLRALNYLEHIFQKMDSSCRRVGFDVKDDFSETFNSEEAFRDYDVGENDFEIDNRKVSAQEYAEAEVNKLNTGQRNAFDTVVDAVENKRGGFFFLQGSGGVGKSFVFNCLIHYLRARKLNVCACASTGIAATLLKGGQTVHSAFCCPNDLDDNVGPRIAAHTMKGRALANLDLLIIDEVSMLDKKVLKFVDRTLQDLKGNKVLFGGVTVLISGDWKQLTPVVPKAGPEQIVDASVKKWSEFGKVRQLNLDQNMRVNANELEFIEFLRQIGMGEQEIFVSGTDNVAIEEALLVKEQNQLINFCYPPEWLQNPDANSENLCGSAILCPTNTVVQNINNFILSKIKREERVFESIDSPVLDDPFRDIDPMSTDEIEKSLEFMHAIETAGMPPHRLRLKVGAIVMLIKNLSVSTGLCNGTRMQIKDVNDSFIRCKVLTGPMSKSKDDIYIPRCKFSYGGTLNEPGIRFTRLQFPVKLSFAITINKAQGQTLERLGLSFRSGECFSHGQLYTAMSRVKTKASLKILTADKAKNTTKNVVWPLLLN